MSEKPRTRPFSWDSNDSSKILAARREYSEKQRICLFFTGKLANFTIALILAIMLLAVLIGLGVHHKDDFNLIQTQPHSPFLFEERNNDTTISPNTTTITTSRPLVLSTSHISEMTTSQSEKGTTGHKPDYMTTSGAIEVSTTSDGSAQQTTGAFPVQEDCSSIEDCHDKCLSFTSNCDEDCRREKDACLDGCSLMNNYCNDFCHNQHTNCHILCQQSKLNCWMRCNSIC